MFSPVFQIFSFTGSWSQEQTATFPKTQAVIWVHFYSLFQYSQFSILTYALGQSISYKNCMYAQWNPSRLARAVAIRLKRFGLVASHRVPCEDRSCEDSGQTARMRRLIWAFAENPCNFGRNAVSRLMCATEATVLVGKIKALGVLINWVAWSASWGMSESFGF